MWLWLRGSGWISTPGVRARHDEHAVRAHHEEDVGNAPALVNHFSPVMTHSPPSRKRVRLEEVRI